MKAKEPKPQRRARAEKPVPFMVRLYKRHKKSIQLYAKVYKISEAEAVRRAIEAAPAL
jgi:hypothetical protein